MKRMKNIFIILLLVALLLQACNLPSVAVGPQPQEAGDDLMLTITAQALILEQAGQTATPTVAQNQAIVFITATEDGAASATPEAVIPAAVLPPATGPVTVTVSIATNCRSGPGQSFASLYGMPVGQVAKVVAKNTTTGYWIIEIPGQNGQTCWLWGQYAITTGDTATLTNVVTPTSVATKTPTATTTSTTKTITPTTTITAIVPAGAIAGCTDSTASNYNSAATVDDGSCAYAVTKPNAPTIKDYACTVTGPDSAGNYTYNYDFVWIDNYNNEDFFTVYVPEGGTLGSSIKYPANSTQHFGSFLLPVATSEFIAVRVTVHNAAGVASSPVTNLICN